MRRRWRMAASSVLLAISAAACLLTAAFVLPSSASAQDASLRVSVAAWKMDTGVFELCFDLHDTATGTTRLCPDLRVLNVAAATEHRWFRSRGLDIAPEVSVWVRARRVGERLDFGLGVREDGRSRGVRARSWSVDWQQQAVNRWLRTSSVALTLQASPYPRLWVTEAGLVNGAQRLEVDQLAPEFVLPRLGRDPESLISLSEAREGSEPFTLLMFWSSWAPYAVETLTELQEIAAQSAEVRAVTVNVYEVGDGAAEQFVREHGLRMLHLVDEDGAVARHYRVDGVPELYVIDWRGVYRGVIRGAAPLQAILASDYGVE